MIKTSQPKVSMVITCYNKQDYIGQMLDSVIAQIWDNIEVIIVNDGSTDNSLVVINSYIPKLKQRGYEVVIVNQENKGRAPALKSGLLKVTGEYVCFPDGDDILFDVYVSAPVEYMETHDDVDFVVSDTDDNPYNQTNSPYLKSSDSIFIDKISNKRLLELWLMNSSYVFTAIWTIMVKYRYFIQCNIIENISNKKFFTQEAQIVLPLFINNGKIYYLNIPTYRFLRSVPHSIVEKALQSKNNLITHTKNYIDTVIYILNKYNALSGKHITMCSIRYLKMLFMRSSFHKEHDLIKKLLNCIYSSINVTRADKIGFSVLHYYIVNYTQNIINSLIQPIYYPDYVIAYGAFGRGTTQILTGLVNSNIKPTVFWDAAAKNGDVVAGISVYTPDFYSLCNLNATVILLIKNRNIAKEVTESIHKLNKNIQILYYFDVMDYLAYYYLDGVHIALKKNHIEY